MADIKLLADRVAQRMKMPANRNSLPVTCMQAVRSTGITHEPDIKRISGLVISELSRRAQEHRKAEAVRKLEPEKAAARYA